MFECVLISTLVGWIVFIIGFAYIDTSFQKAKQLNRWLWNSRLDKLSHPPYLWFMNAYDGKEFIKTISYIMLFNGIMHSVMFLLGYFKIGLVMIVIQPFMMGSIIGMGDDKTKLYGIVTALFEVTGFIISCSLGFLGRIDLWWIPAIFLVLNAVIEASGMFIGVQGVPGMDAIKGKKYK